MKIKNTFTLLLLVLTAMVTQAQITKDKSLNVQLGYGISVPYNSITDVADKGVFAQTELVLKVKSWLELRPYTGVIITNSNGKDLNNNPTFEIAETKAFLLGGKARLRAPIPWVAPYLELGIGTSIGSFKTLTAFDAVDKGGIIYHIPLAFGLELGKNNNVDLGFTYFFQPSVKQFTGAIAVGVTFPLNN